MKNKKTVLILVLVFMVLMGMASILYTELGQSVVPESLDIREEAKADKQEESPSKTEQSEAEAPKKVAAFDFTVYDIEDGEVKLSDQLGKPVVLNFWASWCGPCQWEMPHFEEKYLEFGEEVSFMMVNSTTNYRESREKAERFMENSDYTFPVYYDTYGEATNTYGAHALPITFFIDAEGYVVAYVPGAIPGEILQQGIDMILEKE